MNTIQIKSPKSKILIAFHDMIDDLVSNKKNSASSY